MHRLSSACGYVLLSVGIGFFAQKIIAADLVINEFIPAPGTGNQEWVELYNASESAGYLKSYYLDDDTSFDSDSGSSAKKVLTNLNISNPHYPFFQFSSAMLNNEGDSVVLFDPSGAIVDEYTYHDNPGGDVSIGRYPDQTGQFAKLTSQSQGQANAPPLPLSTSTPTPPPAGGLTPTATLSSTHTPTPTRPQAPTYTPTPLRLLTASRTPTATLITQQSSGTSSSGSQVDVLGEQKVMDDDEPEGSSDRMWKPYIFSTACVGLGLAILSGVFVWRQRIHG